MDSKLSEQLNILAPCRKYGIPLWQCPNFLSLVMGGIIILSMLGSYLVGSYFINNPDFAILVTILITMILFVIDYSIIQGFEKLAQVSRMKSEFVSIVSHQLRTPLSSLNWTIELFLTGQLGKFDPKQMEYLTNMKAINDRMAGLVNDLLDVSKIESGKFPLMPQIFSLTKLIREAVSDFDSFARANNTRLEIKNDGEIFAFADSSKIRQVLDNLLDNAIRYIKENGQVSVRVKKEDGMALVEIRDNGVGIPEKDQELIFHKFFRSKNVMRQQTEGSGLGLFVAKAVIEKSGGKMGFSSKEGGGSIFWFSLPVTS